MVAHKILRTCEGKQTFCKKKSVQIDDCCVSKQMPQIDQITEITEHGCGYRMWSIWKVTCVRFLC